MSFLILSKKTLSFQTLEEGLLLRRGLVITNASIRNNIFVRNIFYQNGGFGVRFYDGTNNLFINNDIYRNASGGLEISGGASNSFINNIFLSNGAVGLSNASPGTLWNHNIVFGHTADYLNSIALLESNNNLVVDPLFSNASAANFQLKLTSYAVDSGTTNGGLGIYLTPFNGQAPDRGAFESTFSNAPGSFSVSSNSTNFILWVWTDNSAIETNYAVFNSLGSNISSFLGANVTTWTQTNLSPNTPYSNRLLTFLPTGTTITSSVIIGWTLAREPRNLAVSNFPDGSIQLSWDPPLGPGGAVQYRVERAPDAGGVPGVWETVALVDAVDPENVQFSNASFSIGSTYYFRVWSLNGASELGLVPTPIVSVTVKVSSKENLDAAIAGPNPYNASKHFDSTVTIANLTAEATIRIYTVSGQLVRTLEENDGDGRKDWDLLDKDGDPVPSGLYILIIKNDKGHKKPLKQMIIR